MNRGTPESKKWKTAQTCNKQPVQSLNDAPAAQELNYSNSFPRFPTELAGLAILPFFCYLASYVIA